jgi:hypothetical protein
VACGGFAAELLAAHIGSCYFVFGRDPAIASSSIPMSAERS